LEPVDLEVVRLAFGRQRLWAALERIEEQHELRRRHLLTRLEPRCQARDPPLEVGVARDQLADDRQHRVPLLVIAQQRAQHVEHRAAQLRLRGRGGLRLVGR
jgi:hypothetical protein